MKEKVLGLSLYRLHCCLLGSVQENNVADVISCIEGGATFIDKKVDFYQVGIECGAIDVLKYMETQGFGFKDVYFSTLAIAMDEDKLKVGKFILEKDLDYDLDDLHRILPSCIRQTNDETLVRLVYEKMIKSSRYSSEMLLDGLKKSCAYNNVDCMKFLIDKIDCVIPDYYIGLTGRIDIVKILHKKGLPLSVAIENARMQPLINDLLEYERYIFEVKRSNAESEVILQDIGGVGKGIGIGKKSKL